jgi:hypothetical protein
LQVYPSADIRLAISHAVAIESGRGWKISKSLASRKIDIVIALAQAVLGAVSQGQDSGRIEWTSGAQRDRGADVWARDDQHVAGTTDVSNRLWANGRAFCEAQDRESARSNSRTSRDYWSKL